MKIEALENTGIINIHSLTIEVPKENTQELKKAFQHIKESGFFDEEAAIWRSAQQRESSYFDASSQLWPIYIQSHFNRQEAQKNHQKILDQHFGKSDKLLYGQHGAYAYDQLLDLLIRKRLGKDIRPRFQWLKDRGALKFDVFPNFYVKATNLWLEPAEFGPRETYYLSAQLLAVLIDYEASPEKAFDNYQQLKKYFVKDSHWVEYINDRGEADGVSGYTLLLATLVEAQFDPKKATGDFNQLKSKYFNQQSGIWGYPPLIPSTNDQFVGMLLQHELEYKNDNLASIPLPVVRNF